MLSVQLIFDSLVAFNKLFSRPEGKEESRNLKEDETEDNPKQTNGVTNNERCLGNFDYKHISKKICFHSTIKKFIVFSNCVPRAY